jgi:two-component system, LytTR family, response regulator
MMPSMRIVRSLIVDDEKPARERLRRLVARDNRVELAGCCASGSEAIEILRLGASAATPVQLMFLDVQMPELDGFGVLSAITNETLSLPTPEVIFVTAHDEYALRAFDAHAVDYLLKPYSDERFQAALDRAVRSIRAGHADALMTQMQALLQTAGGAAGAAGSVPHQRPIDRLVVRGSGRVRLLPVEQINWIEADGMYVKLHTRDGGCYLHRALLGSLDAMLDRRRFVRIHRSAIVNLDVVAELRQDEHGDCVAVLRDKTQVRVGRRFRIRLQTRLGQKI